MFKKIKRKIKAKLNERKWYKKFPNTLKFNKNVLIREKSVLVVEANPYHAETLPGHCKYFADLGYHVDVMMLYENHAEAPFCRYKNNPPRIFVGAETELKRWLRDKRLSQYDFVFFSSYTYKCQDNVIKKFKKLAPAKYGILGVEHDVLFKAKEIYPEIKDKLHENRLFVLSDIPGIPRLNPHYFGDVSITPKHDETTVFTAIGVIDTAVKNHNLLFESVEALLKKGEKNFKVVIIGSGKLEIPEHLKLYIEMRGRLNFSDMYAAVENTDFLVGLMDVNNIGHSRYLNGQASGIVQLSLGFKKPLVVNDVFGAHYGFSAKDAFLYRDNELAEAMVKALKQSGKSYANMQENLSSLADTVYQQSINCLKDVILQTSQNINKKTPSNMALMCKTYRKNLSRLSILKQSIDKYNVENIPFYIVAPEADIPFITKDIVTGNESYPIEVMGEETFLGDDSLGNGWLDQQIVKLRFYKAGVCDFYLMLDSDSYFIRNFYVSDFMYDDKTPYIVCHEGKDAKLINNKCGNSDMFYKEQEIRSFFGREKGRPYRFLTTPIMMSNAVCKELDTKYNAKNLIKMVSCEAAWHGEYLLANHTVDFKPCEPFFKAMVYKKQYNFYKKLKITTNDIRRLYLGIVMQDRHTKGETYE